MDLLHLLSQVYAELHTNVSSPIATMEDKLRLFPVVNRTADYSELDRKLDAVDWKNVQVWITSAQSASGDTALAINFESRIDDFDLEVLLAKHITAIRLHINGVNERPGPHAVFISFRGVIGFGCITVNARTTLTLHQLGLLKAHSNKVREMVDAHLNRGRYKMTGFLRTGGTFGDGACVFHDPTWDNEEAQADFLINANLCVERAKLRHQQRETLKVTAPVVTEIKSARVEGKSTHHRANNEKKLANDASKGTGEASKSTIDGSATVMKNGKPRKSPRKKKTKNPLTTALGIRIPVIVNRDATRAAAGAVAPRTIVPH